MIDDDLTKSVLALSEDFYESTSLSQTCYQRNHASYSAFVLLNTLVMSTIFGRREFLPVLLRRFRRSIYEGMDLSLKNRCFDLIEVFERAGIELLEEDSAG
ncbi:MAG: hypothetical protein IPK50_02010 [Fibrobacterota bacterium]|nr:hypothetical protein [Fibrobacterota bacterium]QQS05674.1 MAG: hypothetical protein IPK50_02010 [Fibrobacterota bacterium]